MINSVRNTVLSVLNKNNYGYISPSDFNLYAQQAQMEVYEEYFSNFNKTINSENKRMSGSDYADISKPLAEVLDFFVLEDNLFPNIPTLGIPNNQFFNPSLTTTGNEAYMINKVLCYTNKKVTGVNSFVTTFQLIDSTVNFINLGVVVGDIVVNNTTNQSTYVNNILAPVALGLNDDIFIALGDTYTIYSYTDYSEAERVSNGKIASLNMSMLTAPSTMFPAYTQAGSLMYIYPTTITGFGAVKATYFRYPKPPKWTYISLAGGEPAFDQSQPDYQDFEVPAEDEYKLAMKILQYCGISIREQQVVQFAMAQEQHEQPTFSQQQ
jgi:hypothetical protein